MIVDTNLLIYSVDDRSRQHTAAREWLDNVLNGSARVGLPWLSLAGFLRITTNPRMMAEPYDAHDAWARIREWLDADVAWIPGPTDRHADVFGRLVTTHAITGNLVPDTHLAAIAVEHGLTVCSTDTDFARFPEVRWIDPLR